MVDPGITIFPKPINDKSSRKPSNEDSASHEDIGFQENGDQTKVSKLVLWHPLIRART